MLRKMLFALTALVIAGDAAEEAKAAERKPQEIIVYAEPRRTLRDRGPRPHPVISPVNPYAERPPHPYGHFTGEVPACATPEALGEIADRFNEREPKFWNSPLQIVGLRDVREVALSPWGPGYIGRRYCRVVADLNIGRPRQVYYSIVENGGFVGKSWGVEWCVAGLDYHRAYAPNCKMAQP